MNRKIVLWILVLLFVVSTATAIGLRPTKTEIIAAEELFLSDELWVVNSNQKSFKVKVYVEGTMSPFVDLGVNELTFSAQDEFLVVPFTVQLPDDVPFGESNAWIVVEETVTPNEENVVSSRLLLKHKIIIQGDYPDKYVVVKMNFQEQDDDVKFVSEVRNVGNHDLDDVRTTFYVQDKENNVRELTTNAAEISFSETKLLTTEVPRSVFERGEFTVSAVTEFDGLEVELVKDMVLGEPEVIPTYFTEFFTGNEVNTYDLDLLNKWNKEVENVYVDVDIKKNNETLDSFRTKSVDIEGLMTERISDYLDARGKDKGLYSFDMVVNFWNRVGMDKKTFHAEFVGKSSKLGWLVGVIVVVLLFGIRHIAKKRKSYK
tara:strand:+ start:130 stop:1251 length:1122 start_codon:yes stop_codon:yes gene_type:complete